jgi:hypothetical protein
MGEYATGRIYSRVWLSLRIMFNGHLSAADDVKKAFVARAWDNGTSRHGRSSRTRKNHISSESDGRAYHWIVVDCYVQGETRPRTFYATLTITLLAEKSRLVSARG